MRSGTFSSPVPPEPHPICVPSAVCGAGGWRSFGSILRVVVCAHLFRLVAGCSWDVAGRLGEGGETTLRTRCNDWNACGVFDWAVEEALAGHGRVVGIGLSEASVGASIHKAPCGGEGTGKSPVDRGQSGWKWSLSADRNGIPVGWAADGADRSDQALLAPPCPPPTSAAWSAISRPCTQTAAAPATRRRGSADTSASTTWCARPNARPERPAASPRLQWSR